MQQQAQRSIGSSASSDRRCAAVLLFYVLFHRVIVNLPINTNSHTITYLIALSLYFLSLSQ